MPRFAADVALGTLEDGQGEIEELRRWRRGRAWSLSLGGRFGSVSSDSCKSHAVAVVFIVVACSDVTTRERANQVLESGIMILNNLMIILLVFMGAAWMGREYNWTLFGA